MIKELRKLIESIERDGKAVSLKNDCLPVLKSALKEFEEYAEVTDKMRQAGWMQHPCCDTPYTKIYQAMERERRA
jgi:hypothetical protein